MPGAAAVAQVPAQSQRTRRERRLAAVPLRDQAFPPVEGGGEGEAGTTV